MGKDLQKHQDNEQQVIVYSNINCGACTTVMTMLDGLDVDYEERNISDKNEWYEEFMEYGVTGVPLLVVDGEVKSVGFDHEAIAELGGN